MSKNELDFKTWDELTEAEREARAKLAFVWKAEHLWIVDPATGKEINAVEYARRYPTTIFDELADFDEEWDGG